MHARQQAGGRDGHDEQRAARDRKLGPGPVARLEPDRVRPRDQREAVFAVVRRVFLAETGHDVADAARDGRPRIRGALVARRSRAVQHRRGVEVSRRFAGPAERVAEDVVAAPRRLRLLRVDGQQVARRVVVTRPAPAVAVARRPSRARRQQRRAHEEAPSHDEEEEAPAVPDTGPVASRRVGRRVGLPGLRFRFLHLPVPRGAGPTPLKRAADCTAYPYDKTYLLMIP